MNRQTAAVGRHQQGADLCAVAKRSAGSISTLLAARLEPPDASRLLYLRAAAAAAAATWHHGCISSFEHGVQVR